MKSYHLSLCILFFVGAALLTFSGCKKEQPLDKINGNKLALGNTTLDAGINGLYSITCVTGGNAIEIGSSSTANYAPVTQYANFFFQNQKWVITDNGSGYYKIMNAYSGKFLDVPGSTTVSGTQLNQYEGNNTDAQLWSITSVGNGAYKITNKGNGLAVTNHNGSTTSGTPVTQETYTGSNTQHWILTLNTDAEYIPNGGWASGIQVFKDLRYNAYLTRYSGWNGGDGCYSLLLPGNNVLWTFQDSFFGDIDNNRSRDGNINAFRRNAGILQQNMSTSSFVQLNSGTGNNSQTWIQYDNLASNDDKELYWPGDAQVHGSTVQVLLSHLKYNTSGGLDHPGTDLAILSLPSLTLTQVIKNKFVGNTTYDGGLLTNDDGYTYMYGSTDNGVAVARAASNDLTQPWQFYTSSGWQNTPDNTVIIPERASIPNVFKSGNKYYFVTQNPNIYLSKDIYIYESASPIGPWTNKRVLYLEPVIPDVLTYNASLHQELSREGELVLSYNTNPFDFWDNFNEPGSADKYRPYFVRIYNWK
ncbi:hypothetical protein J2T02_004888 [Chitinophaga terrae (ex Kim and Jung 2007)]|uniref:DUF5005 domain-containing protein n=1 Tax=Chitinophaga terrae (ex Kim and Jung 2007) TaxID=408074 RepID=UPI0027872B11|nr:DUF5005 domain-containing protein [Chitinophaga terrae (ex Kim and Jung 2007)]MDQ0109743.1 hypothetical protein [Chitinophaga terrae (ex Kim and Jung 2007)]